MTQAWRTLFHCTRPIIGMLHLPPLPGAARFTAGDGAMDAVRQRVLDDTAALVDGGADGLMLENFGDAPFYPGRVPAETIAHMTALAAEVRRRTDLPLGINVLRNDGRSALAIAHAVGARFIRVNILCGARLTDQGVMQGIAHDLLRDRARLGAESIAIAADVDVKHSAALAAIPLDQQVHDLVERGGADALIVSGSGTGKATAFDEVRAVQAAAGDTPVLVGSGITADNIADFAEADGFIVGSSLKTGSAPTASVERRRVAAIVERNRL